MSSVNKMTIDRFLVVITEGYCQAMRESWSSLRTGSHAMWLKQMQNRERRVEEQSVAVKIASHFKWQAPQRLASLGTSPLFVPQRMLKLV